MKTKTVKLTHSLMRRIIDEELGKFGDMEDVEKRAKETEEVDADEYGDALEHPVDYVKALGIEEARLTRRLAQIKEQRSRAIRARGRARSAR